MPLSAIFVPRIFGFKIYKRKGSRYAEDRKNMVEMKFFEEDVLIKMKNKLNNVLGYGPENPANNNEKNTKANDNTMIIDEYNTQYLKK